MPAVGWFLLPAGVLLVQLAGAERNQESKTSIAVTSRAAGHKENKLRRGGHKAVLTLQDAVDADRRAHEEAEKASQAVELTGRELGGTHVEKLGGDITHLVQEVGDKIDDALKASAKTALEESTKYEADVLELHKNLEGFGINADKLQDDLSSEHSKKVELLDKAIQENMDNLPSDTPCSFGNCDPPGGSLVDLGSRAGMQAMPVWSPQPQQQEQQQAPVVVRPASQIAGPPPASVEELPSRDMGSQDGMDSLLGPENGI